VLNRETIELGEDILLEIAESYIDRDHVYPSSPLLAGSMALSMAEAFMAEVQKRGAPPTPEDVAPEVRGDGLGSAETPRLPIEHDILIVMDALSPSAPLSTIQPANQALDRLRIRLCKKHSELSGVTYGAVRAEPGSW
jgi:hypothetical protein